MKPAVFLDKSIAGVKRRLRVSFYSGLFGTRFAHVERERAMDAEPRLHAAKGILLKGGYVLTREPAPPGRVRIDTTFCLPVNYSKGNGRLMFLSIRQFLSKRKSLRTWNETDPSDRYFLPPHIWSDNYYHFLVEGLPALHWALVHTDMRILVPAMKPFLRRFLDYFGWDWQSRLSVFDPHTQVEGSFSGLINIRIIRKGTFTLPNPSLLAFYQNRHASLPEGRDTVLVVSRRHTGDRRILNEDIMVERLSSKFPCEVLVPEREDFTTQVSKLQRARVIVGSHGAGLTNILFHTRLACLVEVTLKDRVNDSYVSLCEALGVRHRLFSVQGSRQEGEGLLNTLLPVNRKSFSLTEEDFEGLLSIVATEMPSV